MSEYIEREALEKALTAAAANDKDKNRRTWAKAICVLHDAPAADAVPVVHGEWLNFYGDFKTAECDRCENLYEVVFDGESTEELFEGFKQLYKYCPHCGAKMDGKEDAE